MHIVLDIAVVAVLALCAWRGAAKGLILTLCGLLAVVVAFLGANWVSDQFSEPLGNYIRPYVETKLEVILEENLSGEIPDISLDGIEVGDELPENVQLLLEEILGALKESQFLTGLIDSANEAIQSGALQLAGTATATVAAYLAVKLARAGLFVLSFILILIAWWLVSRALDLAFRLPVLRTLNKSGGLVFGVLKGALIVLVACHGLVMLDVVTADLAARTTLFSFFLNFQIV